MGIFLSAPQLVCCLFFITASTAKPLSSMLTWKNILHYWEAMSEAVFVIADTSIT